MSYNHNISSDDTKKTYVLNIRFYFTKNILRKIYIFYLFLVVFEITFKHCIELKSEIATARENFSENFSFLK